MPTGKLVKGVCPNCGGTNIRMTGIYYQCHSKLGVVSCGYLGFPEEFKKMRVVSLKVWLNGKAEQV